MKKILVIALSLMILVVIFSGCSKQTQTANQNNEKRVIKTIKGDVEIPANPQRIVDISGSSEILLILGFTPVATANTDPYKPTEFPSYLKDRLNGSKIVGFYMSDTMDVEGIIETNPDLIIMSQRQEKIYNQLKEIAPVIVLKEYDNDWRSRMVDVATLLDKKDVAMKWLEEYDKKAQEIGNKIREKRENESYLSVLASAGQFFVFSNAGIGDIIYNDMKLNKPANLPKQENISLPVVTLEGLSQIDSDNLIVLATETDKKALEESSIWKNIKAVKEGRVVYLDSSPYFGQSYEPIGKELLLDILKTQLTK